MIHEITRSNTTKVRVSSYLWFVWIRGSICVLKKIPAQENKKLTVCYTEIHDGLGLLFCFYPGPTNVEFLTASVTISNRATSQSELLFHAINDRLKVLETMNRK